MPANPKNILLVDGYSLIHRAFHALPLLSSGGVYTNAVQGFFFHAVQGDCRLRPGRACCIMLDTHAPTFRHQMFAEYKAGRKPTPEELRPQFPIIRDILDAMEVTICEMEGYEADDLLGTAARLANRQGIHAYILTGDRDSFQLITADTNVILTKKGISESLLLSPDVLEKEYGYPPERANRHQGADGGFQRQYPGVPGVGEKTALKLINGSTGILTAYIAHAGEIKGKLGEKIRDNKEQAELSRELGTICQTAPLTVDFADCGMENMRKAIPVMEKYKLRRLLELLQQLFTGDKAPLRAPAPEAAEQPPEAHSSIAPMQPLMTVTDEAKLLLIATKPGEGEG